MMSEAALDSPAPSPYCTATTKAGKPCRAPRVGEGDKCRFHSMTPEERSAEAARAARKSAETRAKRVEVREAGLEAARLGLQALLGQRLEARADRVVEVLEDMLDHDNPEVQRRGLVLWLERVYGRPVQPTEDLTPQLQELDITEEQRRAILRVLPPA